MAVFIALVVLSLLFVLLSPGFLTIPPIEGKVLHPEIFHRQTFPTSKPAILVHGFLFGLIAWFILLRYKKE